MPPRIWLEIGHDDDLRDAWWADNWDEARLNVGDLIGDMYVSWYTPETTIRHSSSRRFGALV